MDFNKELDYERIAKLFDEFGNLCKKDNGAIWGINLCAPFVFIDRETRAAAANELDFEGIFTKHGRVCCGTFPKHLVVSASATEFGGKRWAMMPWDYVKKLDTLDGKYTLRTMAHEAFHCIQPKLFGEFAFHSDNTHMDETDARISFLLEISALKKALETTGDERMSAICVALSAREKRRQAYDKALSENMHEMLEGTAVYTEIRLNCLGRDEILAEADKYMETAKNQESIAQYFGYASGALYCLVLDEIGAEWKKDLASATDLGALLMGAVAVTKTSPLDDFNLEPYGYQEIVEQVRQKEETYNAMLREFQDTFTQQPVLRVYDLGSTSISGKFYPIPGLGTVLKGNVEHFGDFGRIFVRNGVFLKNYDEGFCVILADDIKIENNRVIGINWEIELNDRFKVINAEHGFLLSKKDE